jgi:hypothetical protein
MRSVSRAACAYHGHRIRLRLFSSVLLASGSQLSQACRAALPDATHILCKRQGFACAARWLIPAAQLTRSYECRRTAERSDCNSSCPHCACLKRKDGVAEAILSPQHAVKFAIPNAFGPKFMTTCGNKQQPVAESISAPLVLRQILCICLLRYLLDIHLLHHRVGTEPSCTTMSPAVTAHCHLVAAILHMHTHTGTPHWLC